MSGAEPWRSIVKSECVEKRVWRQIRRPIWAKMTVQTSIQVEVQVNKGPWAWLQSLAYLVRDQAKEKHCEKPAHR